MKVVKVAKEDVGSLTSETAVSKESVLSVLEVGVTDCLLLVDETKITDEKKVTFAEEKDLPERFDLPKDHPLYGQRVLKVVPAGMCDQTIGEKGELVAVPVIVKEPEPIPFDPKDVGEVEPG